MSSSFPLENLHRTLKKNFNFQSLPTRIYYQGTNLHFLERLYTRSHARLRQEITSAGQVDVPKYVRSKRRVLVLQFFRSSNETSSSPLPPSSSPQHYEPPFIAESSCTQLASVKIKTHKVFRSCYNQMMIFFEYLNLSDDFFKCGSQRIRTKRNSNQDISPNGTIESKSKQHEIS